MMPGKRLMALHSWASTVSPGPRVAAALGRVVSADLSGEDFLGVMAVPWPDTQLPREPGLAVA